MWEKIEEGIKSKASSSGPKKLVGMKMMEMVMMMMMMMEMMVMIENTNSKSIYFAIFLLLLNDFISGDGLGKAAGPGSP